LIKPTLYNEDNKLLAKSVSLRLFPEFQSNPNTVWIPSEKMEASAPSIIAAIIDHYKSLKVSSIPHVILVKAESDLQKNNELNIQKWWIFPSVSDSILDKAQALSLFSETEPNIIYISEFKRDDIVPQNCEIEKQLSHECLKAVSVREVKKKFKSNSPYFFMRRYNENQFYLFIESIR
jgi:hypothetical protein